MDPRIFRYNEQHVDPVALYKKFRHLLKECGVEDAQDSLRILFEGLKTFGKPGGQTCPFPLLSTVKAAHSHAKKIRDATPGFKLMAAQRVLAKFYGYSDWGAFVRAVEKDIKEKTFSKENTMGENDMISGVLGGKRDLEEDKELTKMRNLLKQSYSRIDLNSLGIGSPEYMRMCWTAWPFLKKKISHVERGTFFCIKEGNQAPEWCTFNFFHDVKSASLPEKLVPVWRICSLEAPVVKATKSTLNPHWARAREVGAFEEVSTLSELYFALVMYIMCSRIWRNGQWEVPPKAKPGEDDAALVALSEEASRVLAGEDIVHKDPLAHFHLCWAIAQKMDNVCTSEEVTTQMTERLLEYSNLMDQESAWYLMHIVSGDGYTAGRWQAMRAAKGLEMFWLRTDYLFVHRHGPAHTNFEIEQLFAGRETPDFGYVNRYLMRIVVDEESRSIYHGGGRDVRIKGSLITFRHPTSQGIELSAFRKGLKRKDVDMEKFAEAVDKLPFYLGLPSITVDLETGMITRLPVRRPGLERARKKDRWERACVSVKENERFFDLPRSVHALFAEYIPGYPAQGKGSGG